LTKLNNPGWPDPTDWARRLYDLLEEVGENYQLASWEVADDPDAFEGLNLKQARAAEALLAVSAALRELPLFEKSRGAAILHDVAGALSDVVLGGAPRLFASVRAGEPGGDGIHRIYIKTWVVLAVRFLVEAHAVSEPAARDVVATIFSRAGTKGRKGNPLSASTVRDWCVKAHPLSENWAEASIHREVEAHLEKYRNAVEWPGSYEDALAWIERLATDPLLRSKYG
jgi:hypothetical protein